GRRALMRFERQLGAFNIWTKVHVASGTLALVGVLLHSGFRFGGIVTSALMLLLFAAVLTGAFGLWFYRWMPRTVTRIEGESQVEEDLLEERRSIRWRAQDLLTEASDALFTRSQSAIRLGPDLPAIYRSSYDGRRARAGALEAIQTMIGGLT